MSPRANNSKVEREANDRVVVNDSPVDWQSREVTEVKFSAEKIQDRWFKVSAAASVGASALQRCPPDTRTLPPQPNQIPLLIQFVLIVVSLFYIVFKPFRKHKRCIWEFLLLRATLSYCLFS